MRVVLLVWISFLLVITGCANRPYYYSNYSINSPLNPIKHFTIVVYDFELQEVTRTINNKADFFRKIFSDSSFDDEYVFFKWNLTGAQAGFSLENKESNSIKIIWDDSIFVDADNVSKKIIHEGVKFVDRSSFIPPTVIAGGSKIKDFIVPSDSIEISNSDVGWETKGILPHFLMGTDPEGYLKKQYRPFIGKTLKVLIVIESHGNKFEYTFNFLIKDAHIQTQ